jgi:hypothetical protein
MTNNPTIVAGIIIAAAILVSGYFGRSTRYETFQLSAAGKSGETVWRIDTRNGRISMCGSLVDGTAFSAMQKEHESTIPTAARSASPESRQHLIEEAGNIHTLSRPRCTEWTED